MTKQLKNNYESDFIDTGTFERTVLTDQKLSALLTELPNSKVLFKGSREPK